MKKLIEFIKKIHWKIYGKNHLLSELIKGRAMAVEVHNELGEFESDNDSLKKRLEDRYEKRLEEYTEAIKDVESC